MAIKGHRQSALTRQNNSQYPFSQFQLHVTTQRNASTLLDMQGITPEAAFGP
jgi:hypothetical protein